MIQFTKFRQFNIGSFNYYFHIITNCLERQSVILVTNMYDIILLPSGSHFKFILITLNLTVYYSSLLGIFEGKQVFRKVIRMVFQSLNIGTDNI